MTESFWESWAVLQAGRRGLQRPGGDRAHLQGVQHAEELAAHCFPHLRP